MLRGACHRAGYFEPDPLARNDNEQKKERRNAERRSSETSAFCDAARALVSFPSPLVEEGREGARPPSGVPPRLEPLGLSPRGRNSRPCFLGRGGAFGPVMF